MAEFGSGLSASDRDRALYWKERMDNAKDEHEVTRIYVEHRLDSLGEWLADFDRRIAKEMREHARKTQGLILGLAAVIVFLHWL